MASILVRKLDETVKARLRLRAARNGRSMEEEAREILNRALREEPRQELNFAQSLRRYVEPFGGVELAIPKRGRIRNPPTFE